MAVGDRIYGEVKCNINFGKSVNIGFKSWIESSKRIPNDSSISDDVPDRLNMSWDDFLRLFTTDEKTFLQTTLKDKIAAALKTNVELSDGTKYLSDSTYQG